MTKSKVISLLAVAYVGPLVEAFLAANSDKWTATSFSKAATNDPAKVARMRKGQEIRASTATLFVEKINAEAPGFVQKFLEQQTVPGLGLK